MYGVHNTFLLCKCYGTLSSLCDTGALQCGDLNYLTSQLFAQLVDVDLISGLLYDIHHVDRHDYRNTKFQDLG